MRKMFRSIDEVLRFGSVTLPMGSGARGTDRILKSTRLEDKLYAELREGDEGMDGIEAQCGLKLSTFPALSRDIYQSFYSLSVRRNDESELSDTAKQFNSNILDSVMGGDEYPTIKSVCEGRQLPAYDAAVEFIANVSNRLDDLLKKAGGDKGALSTLEKLSKQEDELKRELEDLLQSRDREQAPDENLGRKIVDKANMAASKTRQVEAVGRQIRDNLMKNQDAIVAIVAQAAQSSIEKAEETAAAIAAWGTGDGVGPEQMKLDREVVDRVRKSPALAEAARHLGRFREMAAKARKNGYAYGRGEKYTLELGNDLNRVLTSEFSMLATPETIPLFLRKYQNKRLHQYKRREPVYKGAGDTIVCLDESDSTKDDAPWGKAVALALLDAAMAGNRKFALIHFSSGRKCETDMFLPGRYSTEDIFSAVETFLGGGTDFVAPLNEAVRLIESEGFDNADIVFVTDGECRLPDSFCDGLVEKKATHRFRITGVIMDVESPGMSFSLKPFCEDIYRTSELSRDSIVESIIADRI